MTDFSLHDSDLGVEAAELAAGDGPGLETA
jgi:hypothetical protein